MQRFRVILHPTDFSECSEAAFPVASALARDHDARLVVLHVAPGEPDPVETVEGAWEVPAIDRDAVEERLRRVRVPGGGVPLEHRLGDGDVVEGILRVAEETRCDLIVMGTHGRGELGRVLMGSVAEAVVRRAPCPVLSLKSAVAMRYEPPAALWGSAKE